MIGVPLATLSTTSLGWDHGDMGMGWLPMITFGSLFVALAVVIWRATRRTRDGRETPLQVLNRRLAEGSITSEEFQHRRSLIDPQAAQGQASTGHAPSPRVDLVDRSVP